MYSLQITTVRPNIDIPFFWETTLADHDTYISKRGMYYTGEVSIGDPVFSEDRLTATTLCTAPSYEIFYDCKNKGDVDPYLVRYYLTRSNYNFDNNISRTLTEL